MIIDAHTHLSLFQDDKYTASQRVEHLKRFSKSAGISKILVFSTISAVEKDPLTIKKLLELIKDEKNMYAVAGISVKYTDKDLKEIEKYAKEKKIVAVKIYPGYEAMYPADKRFERIIRLCEKYDLPLIMHSGDTLGSGAGVKYSHPIHVDDLATRHPRLKIVIAHLGNPWTRETMEVLYRHENVYADTSALVWDKFDPYWKKHYTEEIRHILKWCNNNKLIFGTDWPCNDKKEYSTYIKNCTDFFKNIKLSKEDKEKILHLNAEKVFRI